MAKYFRHYRALAQQLGRHTDPVTSGRILNGMDTVTTSSPPEAKVRWARVILERMESELDQETCIRVREGCACVQSNEKSIYARSFRKLRRANPEDRYLDEVVKYLNATTPLRRCGEVTLEGEEIHSTIARGRCDCSALRGGLREPISVTWCHCCKGSLLSVYRHVYPDRQCDMRIVGTVASGAKECRFVTTYRPLAVSRTAKPGQLERRRS